MATKDTPLDFRVAQAGSALWLEISMPCAAPGNGATVVTAGDIAVAARIEEAVVPAAALAKAADVVVGHELGSWAAVAGPLPESVNPAVTPSPAIMISAPPMMPACLARCCPRYLVTRGRVSVAIVGRCEYGASW